MHRLELEEYKSYSTNIPLNKDQLRVLTEVARIDVTPSSDEDGVAPTIDRHEKAQDRRRGVSAVGQATPMPADRRRGRWSDAAISRSFREVFAAASRFTSGDGRAQIHFGTCLLLLNFSRRHARLQGAPLGYLLDFDPPTRRDHYRLAHRASAFSGEVISSTDV